MTTPGASTGLTRVLPDGRSVRYDPVVILPAGPTGDGVATTTVRAEEVHRPDLVTFRTLGNPLLSHRLAAANDAMDLFGLCDEVGAELRLPRSTPS